MSFENQGLCKEILQAIEEMGFTEPMPIQKKVIQLLLNDPLDLIALAQTGTGKTAAYSLPLIQLIDTGSNKTQAIILTPTRELCLQVSKDISKFAKYIEGFRVLAVYGGAQIDTQIRSLRRGVHVIVGTPGRVHDLIRRKYLDISSINTLVLDEADEMLTMGFKEELDAILATTPKDRQTLLFSATMPAEIVRISKAYMKSPIQINAGKPNSSSENIQHVYYSVKHSNKYLALKRIVDTNPDIFGIVFCRTREETREITAELSHDGYNADALHGDISQSQREVVLNKFRKKNLQLLVATDVAARGIDINNITHVINFTLPDDVETYVHRCGRTGRAGKSGISISLISNKELHKIRRIEKFLHREFEHHTLPSSLDICRKKVFHKIDQLTGMTVDNSVLDSFLPDIYKQLESLSREEIIKLFLYSDFQEFFEYYIKHKDKNLSDDEPTYSSNRNGRGQHSNYRSKDDYMSSQKERRKRIKRRSPSRN
jgi:ATP-dependent RNA helicase DeaD